MQENTGLDIFDELGSEDLSTVDTSYPILAPGQYEFQVKEATKEEAESGYQYLLFKCSLVTPNAVDTNGNPVPVGYVMRNMIGLTPAEKTIKEVGLEEAKKRIKANVVKFLDAVVENRYFDPTLETYVGLNFFAKTRVSKERTDPITGQVYAPQAEFSSFIPLT